MPQECSAEWLTAASTFCQILHKCLVWGLRLTETRLTLLKQCSPFSGTEQLHLGLILQDKAAMTQRWHAWEQEQKAIMQRQLQDQQLQASHTAA